MEKQLTWGQALKRFWRLNRWEKPTEFRSLSDVDFSPEDRWWAAWALIRTDGLLMCLMSWQILMACGLSFLLVTRSWGFAGLASVALQGGWCLIAARADDLAAGRKSGLESIWRALRTWPVIAIFGLVPGWVIGLLLWWVAPVRLWVSLAQENLPIMSWAFMGRFWHCLSAWMFSFHGGGTARERFDLASRVTNSRRTDLFDRLASDVDRYMHALILGLFVFVAMWIGDNALWIFLKAFVFFFAISSVLQSAISMVWFPMVYRAYVAESSEEVGDARLPEAARSDVFVYVTRATVVVIVAVAPAWYAGSQGVWAWLARVLRS